MLSIQQQHEKRKGGRTIEFTRFQCFGNIDGSLANKFVILLLFREHRYRKGSIALRWVLRDGKAKFHIPDGVLPALGIYRGLFRGAAKGELGVGILLVESVVVNEMLCFEDDNDEGSQFPRHCGLGQK